MIADATIYIRSSNLLCGVGNIDDHFLVLDHLVSTGQFLAMVANFIFRVFCKTNHKASTLQGLVSIYNHPCYARDIVHALNYLEAIQSNVGVLKIAINIDVEASCLFYSGA